MAAKEIVGLHNNANMAASIWALPEVNFNSIICLQIREDFNLPYKSRMEDPYLMCLPEHVNEQ